MEERYWPADVNVVGNGSSRGGWRFNLPAILRPKEIMIRQGRTKFGFGRASRLRLSSEFKLVKESGKSWTGRYLILVALNRGAGLPSRVGMITTRRLGNAVVRNQVRRRMREIFRLNQDQIRDGYWIVTIARASSAFVAYQELERDWLRLAKRASILESRSHGSNSADLTSSV